MKTGLRHKRTKKPLQGLPCVGKLDRMKTGLRRFLD